MLHAVHTDPGIRLIERMIQSTVLTSVQTQVAEVETQLDSVRHVAVSAELRQLSQEFRHNRREYSQASDTVEDLEAEAADQDPPSRQLIRARNFKDKLHQDMMQVLATLNEQCIRHNHVLTDYISSEDASMLPSVSHE
jgi:hypothetical protein